ncbi:MAG TPA: DUF2997 domain-containing protein [Anaerohalosphaeraceae bacterium]|jgi:hypothetical protein|nr:DUF2997 domain-containing protein [Anaerohalosphaeraceae bacterium]HRT50482.1 DUF2997 domain-containing protein [Anaerohalosphaeraceae bacterium]HRT86412.1 DUF2997 domain-containing protein [Anaerohalosphaeraceae bacterium]
MPQHEVEIVISKTGEVKVHVKGAKGKACLEYANWLAEAIGRVKDQKLTSEYYEPEQKARINLKQELRRGD